TARKMANFSEGRCGKASRLLSSEAYRSEWGASEYPLHRLRYSVTASRYTFDNRRLVTLFFKISWG
ncbi:MAG: hypothetical protein K6T34_10360, partial [Thermoflavifilum sp.]|nr:hypothetical protein [Thermoflavifilum sp.]